MDDTLNAIQVLTFQLCEEMFGIEISSVREVLDKSSVTRVPQMPEYVTGVINLRGSVVPVIDMNQKFYNKASVTTLESCIIVLEVPMGNDLCVIGALVDSVDEVVEFDSSTLEPAPKMGTQLKTHFIKCMAKKDDHFAIILDVGKVFSEEETLNINQLNESKQGNAPV